MISCKNVRPELRWQRQRLGSCPSCAFARAEANETVRAGTMEAQIVLVVMGDIKG